MAAFQAVREVFIIEWESTAWIWLSGLLFAVTHSLLASRRCKQYAYRSGLREPRYRLMYSVASIFATAGWIYFVFIVDGIYRRIRHPMYTGAMLMVLAMPEQSWNGLHFALALCVYFIIGSRFEESRMLAEHLDYGDYRSHVPAFIPAIRMNGKNG